MKRCLLILCFASFFVDAAKRNLDFGSASEKPLQKIQRLSLEEAVVVQESGLSILADLVPLFLRLSDHQLAPSLSQVNRACFKAVCFCCYEATRTMPPIFASSASVGQPGKIILNFALQHLVRAIDTAPRLQKLSALVKILTGLNSKNKSIAVTEILQAMILDQTEKKSIYHMLALVHRHREENGDPAPYQSIYPKIVLEGFESFSERINSEIVRMLRYMENPNLPSYHKNTEIYHKFFQDMLLMFPEYCAQKYQELHDTEAVFPQPLWCARAYTTMFNDIMGSNADPAGSALAIEPIESRLKNNDFVHLWKIIFNKLTFLPRRIPVHLNAQFDHLDLEISAELTRVLNLVRALETPDNFSLEGLSDMKILYLKNYISNILKVSPTTVFIRSIAARVVNAKDIVTAFHLDNVLRFSSFEHFISQLIQEKISAMSAEECVFEPLKFIGPSTILSFIKYHDLKKLPQSFWQLLQSNLRRIALGDKEMAGKYECVLRFIAESFPDDVGTIASFVVSAALADQFLAEEKNLFFIFDAIPGMAVLLRNIYDSIISKREIRTE